MKSVGVIVGRFQVHNFTAGHADLLEQVAKKHQDMLIVLGVSPSRGSRRDPLDFDVRKSMFMDIREWLNIPTPPNVVIVPLVDCGGDDADVLWSDRLDDLITKHFPGHKPTLYGSRDSFIPHYKGKHEVVRIGQKKELQKETGTSVREQISKRSLASSEFRSGIIYGAYNQFPRVFPTVDVAVMFDYAGDGWTPISRFDILMGRKHKYEGLRFIGGFVDPTDKSFAAAAFREMGEECPSMKKHIDNEAQLYMQTSMRVADWRYRERDAIITTLFTAWIKAKGKKDKPPKVKAGDDLSEIGWYPLNEKLVKQVCDPHKPLVKWLLGDR